MIASTKLTLRVFVLALAGASPTAAQSATEPDGADDTPKSGLHLDAEIDPTAYVFSGHSLHVGIGYRHLRLDFGNFAMDIPGFLDPNQGFAASASGFGVKLQLFPFAEHEGFFAGVDAGLIRMLVERDRTSLAATQYQVPAGIHLGYRIPLPASFYLSPWIGLAYTFGADDLALGDATYEVNAFTVFPAIHLGYQAR
jgi:hypothetical protein